jgi:hypothetical protein
MINGAYMRAILFLFLNTMLLFSSELKLTQKQADYIAKKVWINEGAGLDKYLVHWNEGEDFASVGIGHFIWFSEGHTERFQEVFPMVLAFMEERNVTMPQWLNAGTPLPWNSKTEFYRAKNSNSKKYRELFDFLKRTMPQQAEFMAARLSHALPEMLSTIDNEEKKQRIKRCFNSMLYHTDGSIDERGLYILLDYTNFKGEGTLESERYKGQGWGLLQVLEHLDENIPDKYKAFADAAKMMLARRIGNSPPARGEERWRKGWNVRLDTYWK